MPLISGCSEWQRVCGGRETAGTAGGDPALRICGWGNTQRDAFGVAQ